MQGYAWVNLIRQVPPPLQELLVLITSTGIEIQVQNVLRLELDFAVVRGRTTGSVDVGMVMIVPFDQISHVAFYRRLTDAEVGSIFDNFVAPTVASVAAAAAPAPTFTLPAPRPDAPAPVRVTAPREAAEPTPTEASPSELGTTSGASSAPGGRQVQPSKSILLARLRARLAQDSSRQTGGK